MLRLWVKLKFHCFATVWVLGGTGGRAGGGRGRGLLIRGHVGTAGVATPLSGYLLGYIVQKASQEPQRARGFT